MKIMCACDIARPPEIIFPWLAEPAKAMQWQTNVKQGEILVNAPDVVGTRFKEVIQEDSGRLEMYGEITKYIENRIIEFHLESRIHRLDVSYSLDPNDGHTKIMVDAAIHWKFPMNVMSTLIGNKMKKNISDQLESELLVLKQICETERGGALPQEITGGCSEPVLTVSRR